MTDFTSSVTMIYFDVEVVLGSFAVSMSFDNNRGFDIAYSRSIFHQLFPKQKRIFNEN